MIIYLSIIAFILTMLLMISLVYILRAPDNADCLLSTQLVGTIGVVILAMLSIIKNQPYLLDIALVLALLTSILVLTFTQLSKDTS